MATGSSFYPNRILEDLNFKNVKDNFDWEDKHRYIISDILKLLNANQCNFNKEYK